MSPFLLSAYVLNYVTSEATYTILYQQHTPQVISGSARWVYYSMLVKVT